MADKQTILIAYASKGLLPDRTTYLIEIMSKRSAGLNVDLVVAVKQRCKQVKTGLTLSIDPDDSAVDSSRMSSTLPVTPHPISSTVESLEDSGIEVTPAASKSLIHKPNVPDFLLNPPKSFPAPKFDFCSNDTDNFLPVSNIPSSDKGGLDNKLCMNKNPISETVLHGSNTSRDSKNEDACALSSVTSLTVSQVCEDTSPLACCGTSGSEDLKLKNETEHFANDSVVSSESQSTPTTKETNILGDIDHYEASRLGIGESDSVHNKTNDNQMVSKFPTELDRKAETPNHCSLKEQTGKQQTQRRLQKRTQATTSSTRMNYVPSKQSDFGKDHVKDHKDANETTQSDSKKKKQTVLPVSLLEGVVKTVQENVESISKQVVASSEFSAPVATCLVACSTQNIDSLAANTQCLNRETSLTNSPQDRHVKPRHSCTGSDAASLSEQDCRNHSNSKRKGKQEIKKERNRKLNLELEDIHENRNQNAGEEKLGLESELLLSSSCSTHPAQIRTKTFEKLTDIAQSISENDHSSPASSPKFEASSQSLLPVDCAETDQKIINGEKQKAKKRAKKKRKKCNRQRKSAEGEGACLPGILPDYDPESDSCLNRKTEDEVYDLSALFSGQLLKNRRPPKRPRPNYFFAIQITSPEVKKGLLAVQQAVEKASPKLSPAFVRVESAHLTLGVMHLPDDEAVAIAISVMDEFRGVHQNQQLMQQGQERDDQELEQQPSAEERTVPPPPCTSPTCSSEVPHPSDCTKIEKADSLKDIIEKGATEEEKSGSPGGEKKPSSRSVLTVQGLDTFRDNVVFAKVTEGPALDKVKAMAELLRSQILEQDISMDPRPFVPHITLMKMSKNPGILKAAGIKRIDSKLYLDFADMNFGSSPVTTIQLCSMLKPKKNNYYHIEYEVPVSLH